MDEVMEISEFTRNFIPLDSTYPQYRALVDAARKANAEEPLEEGSSPDVGGNILMAVNRDPNFNLCATLASPSGLVYRRNPGLLEDDQAFWLFAAKHYYWITMKVDLRKELAVSLLGQVAPIRGRSPDRTRTPSSLMDHESAMAIMFPVRKVHHF